VWPSPNDLRAVGATVELAKRARRRMVFVISQATQRARITAEAAILLSQYGTVAVSGPLRARPVRSLPARHLSQPPFRGRYKRARRLGLVEWTETRSTRVQSLYPEGAGKPGSMAAPHYRPKWPRRYKRKKKIGSGTVERRPPCDAGSRARCQTY
jgi:hypothetical protein